MSKLSLVLPLGLALLPLLVTLRGRRLGAVTYWALAGLILWVTGLALALAETWPTALAFSYVAGPASTTLFFLGARRFAHSRSPAWVPAFGALGGLLTGAAYFALGRFGAVVVESLVCAPLLVASAVTVCRNAWRQRASLAEKALGVTLVVLAAVMPADLWIRLYGLSDAVLLALWLSLFFAIAFLTLASLADRAARRARRLSRERELLRRVTRCFAGAPTPRAALARVAEEIRADGALRLIALRLVEAGSKPSDLAGGGDLAPEAQASLQHTLAAGGAAAQPVAGTPGSVAVGFAANAHLRGVLAVAPPADAKDGRPATELARDLADEIGRLLAHLELAAGERDRSLELERAQQTLFAVARSSPLAIALTDPDGALRYVNDKGFEMLGLDAMQNSDDLAIEPMLAAVVRRIPPERGEEISRRLREKVGKDDTIPHLELELDGLLVDTMSVPVRGAEGQLLGRVWVGRDMTEERRLAEDLQQAQRMQTVGTLAGGIAHDFNNQLTAIMGNLDLLLAEIAPGDPRRDAALAARGSAKHCAELTRGLLDFARQRPLRTGSVAVAEVVADVASLLRPALPSGVELRTEIASDVGAVVADADELWRVLMNLGVNARDAVAERGQIEIAARRLSAGRDAEVELSVSDDGSGIDETTRTRIYDPFFSTKPPGEGTGLGLSVVYGIVQRHGARIELDPTPGRGTCFRVFWPAASETGERALEPEPAQAAPASATVLLAEDDPGVRKVTRHMLEGAGYRVLEAPDGPGAVACHDEHVGEVDLLLLDLSMPGCSGLEALERIRSAAATTPPVILMSGNPAPLPDPAPSDFELLMKPFGSAELLDRVRGALSRGGPVA